MTNETEEQIKKGIEILERYRENSLVQRVVKGKTQFQEEVQNFYGILNNPRVILNTVIPGIITGLPGGGRGNGKKYPINLIEILNEFGSKPLNTDLLAYEDVRTAYGFIEPIDESFNWKDPFKRKLLKNLRELKESKLESKREHRKLLNYSFIADKSAEVYKQQLLTNALSGEKEIKCL